MDARRAVTTTASVVGAGIGTGGAVLAGAPPVPAGLGGIAALCVLMVLTGDLVPRRTHEDMLHDRDEWRGESRIKDAQIAEKDTQLAYMRELGRTMEAVLSAVQRVLPRPKEEDRR